MRPLRIKGISESRVAEGEFEKGWHKGVALRSDLRERGYSRRSDQIEFNERRFEE